MVIERLGGNEDYGKRGEDFRKAVRARFVSHAAVAGIPDIEIPLDSGWAIHVPEPQRGFYYDQSPLLADAFLQSYTHLFGIEASAIWDWEDKGFREALILEQTTGGTSFIDKFYHLTSAPWFECSKAVATFEQHYQAFRSILARTERRDAWGQGNNGEIEKALQRYLDRVDGKAWGHHILGLLRESNGQGAISRSNGIAYEGECLAAAKVAGWKVERTPQTGDKGVDLIIETPNFIVAVQCKDTNRAVGVKAIQEVNAGYRYWKADHAVVLAESGFTSAAEDLASSLKILLLNIHALPQLENILLGH